jgi:hypothetical protein
LVDGQQESVVGTVSDEVLVVKNDVRVGNGIERFEGIKTKVLGENKTCLGWIEVLRERKGLVEVDSDCVG